MEIRTERGTGTVTEEYFVVVFVIINFNILGN
jgi:hypothetical protein